MVYILAAILMFGILIGVHELGHFLAAKACGVRVNEFSIGMGPAIWKKQKGETLYAWRLFPIGGYCAMEGEEEDSEDPTALNNQGFWKKLLIFAAGAIMNFVAGLVIILLLYSGTKAFYEPVVTNFAEGCPTQCQQGLQMGDELLKINNERIYVFSDISLLLGRLHEDHADFVVKRDGERITLNNVPMQYGEYKDGEGRAYHGYGLLFYSVKEANFADRVAYSWNNAIDFVRIVRLSLQMLGSGEAGLGDMSGPVGIVSTMTQVGEQSATVRDAIDNIAYLAALIAVNLAVMNLLPLPALDGGKIFFLVVNAITMALFRKQIPAKYENYVHYAGLILLLGLMAVITFHDIWKLFT